MQGWRAYVHYIAYYMNSVSSDQCSCHTLTAPSRRIPGAVSIVALSGLRGPDRFCLPA